MRTWLLAAAIPLVLTGCGAPPYPGPQLQGTVAGRVLAWPCAPVELANSPCPGRPAASVAVDFWKGDTYKEAVTDATGSYSIRLDTGSYRVKIGRGKLISGPEEVTVTAGQTTKADFSFDSGIR
jgi:hypothetical protein